MILSSAAGFRSGAVQSDQLPCSTVTKEESVAYPGAAMATQWGPGLTVSTRDPRAVTLPSRRTTQPAGSSPFNTMAPSRVSSWLASVGGTGFGSSTRSRVVVSPGVVDSVLLALRWPGARIRTTWDPGATVSRPAVSGRISVESTMTRAPSGSGLRSRMAAAAGAGGLPGAGDVAAEESGSGTVESSGMTIPPELGAGMEAVFRGLVLDGSQSFAWRQYSARSPRLTRTSAAIPMRVATAAPRSHPV